MPLLADLIPDAATVVAMHPADLGAYVLEELMRARPDEAGRWNRSNFCQEAGRSYVQRGEGAHRGVMEACAAAWAWLSSNWLICQHPENGHDWYIATRLGREIKDRLGVRRLVEEQELPAHFLHPEMAASVRPLFLQRRFDTAVFEAFKALEVSVRHAAGLGNDLTGARLIAKAFQPEGGPLSDPSAEAGERQALLSLMNGAFGSYKNPHSHRHVGLDAAEAREMIMLASHLLKIVESRGRAASINGGSSEPQQSPQIDLTPKG